MSGEAPTPREDTEGPILESPTDSSNPESPPGPPKLTVATANGREFGDNVESTPDDSVLGSPTSDGEGEEEEEEELPSIAKPLHRMHSFVVGKGVHRGGSGSMTGTLSPRATPSPTPGGSPALLSPPREHKPQTLHHHLLTVPHLCTIPFSELLKLDIMTREYAPMDNVLDAGSAVQHVYILIAGAIEVFAEAQIVGSKRVGRLTAPGMFGMHNVLLDNKCKFTMRAGTTTTILLLKKDDFFKLLRRHKVFASSVSPKIVDQLNVFQNFQTLCRAIFAVSSVRNESDSFRLDMRAILDAYGKIWNGIHRGQLTNDIDYLGWKHAIRRLPQNIVETFVLTLSRTLPPFVRKELEFLKKNGMDMFSKEFSTTNFAGDSPIKMRPVDMQNISFIMADSNASGTGGGRPSPIVNVPTSDRRRKAYQIARGHTYVMLREGFTDVLDIVSCLCIHLIEGRKTRHRLQSMVSPTALDVLQGGLQLWNRTRPTDQCALMRETLLKLNLTTHEVDGLIDLWPHSAMHRLNALLTSREELVVRLDTSLARRFDTDPYIQWALSLRNRVLHAMELSEGAAVPPTTVIDILCCNTHTPKNLLCRFAREHKGDFVRWGQEHRPAVMLQEDWHNTDDRLYYLASSCTATDKDWGEIYRETLAEDGFVVMDDPELTGLQVDIIDIDRIDPTMVDEVLKPAFAAREAKKASDGPERRHFILNLDFAFGAQADGILRALILTFGENIRSVNVISKAGGLRGAKGDIVLPEQLVFSKQVLGDDTPDEFRSTGNKDITKRRVEELAGPKRTVRCGPVLTIPGLVLQNEKVLKYYHCMWSCDGVEMEGSYYARQVEESIGLGLLKPSVVTRFGYHVVDLPLAGLQLSRVKGKPTAIEAVPPMYALGRALMEKIVLL